MFNSALKLTRSIGLAVFPIFAACGAGNDSDIVAEIETEVEVSISQPDLRWGTHAVIADLGEGRYFLSPGDNYTNRQPLSGLWTPADPGSNAVVSSVDGQTVPDGTEVTLQIRHGDRIPIELQIAGATRQFTLVVSPLPLLAIQADAIVDEPKLPGRYQWVDGNVEGDEGQQNLAIELRGVTAQALPKKAYAIEFRKTDEPDKSRNVQLYNLRNDDDWIADAAYRDLTFVRNLVSHDIYRDMQPQAHISDNQARGQSTIAGGLAEVILNRNYHGLYVIHERIDRKLLDLEKVTVPEDETGDRWDLVDFSNPENGSVLFKAQAISASFYRPEQIREDFEQKYPDLEDADRFDQLEALFDLVHNTTSNEFVAQVGDVIDMPSIVDMWLLRLLTANTDTLGKNYYLARNRTGKWFFQPWDYDATFGVSWRGAEAYAQTIEFFRPEQNLLIRRLWSIPQTGFNAAAQTRWSQLRQSLFTTSAIRARFDSYLAVAGTDTSDEQEHPRNRNLRRWPESGNEGAGNNALGESAYIAMWLDERLAFVDQKIASLRLE